MEQRLYGIAAEVRTADDLLDAVRRARAEGFRDIEAYTPLPVEGLAEALEFRRDRVAPVTLIGGILGGTGGYFMQWYSAVFSYPINVGGRPLHSWPSFIPATFELTVLGAALAAFAGMLVMNGLPRLYHPIFNLRQFELASRNRFFLCIRSRDRSFDPERTRAFLASLQPVEVSEVPL
jgi:hypothetical protein